MVTLGTFAGGIGLFLLGMHLMTEGLKVAAGDALRNILARATDTRFRALLSGALITGLVQSSSAVTIAAIGFVNAGLLHLGQAIWVVFGANVGTTVTGWLVALTGLEIDLASFALPGIGIGTLVSTFGGARRIGAIGQAVAGFGLFFLGLAFMKTAFGDVAAGVDPASLAPGGVAGVLLFAVFGLVLTAATQSSSASLALALSAAASGLIPITEAGAWVIGANLGTTSTALISVIGATPNARRTAMAHVAFNVLAALVAFLLLPVAFRGIDALLRVVDVDLGPATELAAFHTAFNLLGVALIWPLSGALTRFLEHRFVTETEEESRALHLDANVLAVPAVAVDALRLESQRVLTFAARAVKAACADPRPDAAALARNTEVTRQLSEKISDFSTRLDRSSMSSEVAEGLRHLVRSAHHVNIVLEQAAQLAELRQRPQADESGLVDVPWLLGAVREIADLATKARPSLATLKEHFKTFGARYQQAVSTYAKTAAIGARGTEQALYRQQVASEARRAAKHLTRAAEELYALGKHLEAATEVGREVGTGSETRAESGATTGSEAQSETETESQTPPTGTWDDESS